MKQSNGLDNASKETQGITSSLGFPHCGDLTKPLQSNIILYMELVIKIYKETKTIRHTILLCSLSLGFNIATYLTVLDFLDIICVC